MFIVASHLLVHEVQGNTSAVHVYYSIPLFIVLFKAEFQMSSPRAPDALIALLPTEGCMHE